jgi:hypothetical protein
MFIWKKCLILTACVLLLFDHSSTLLAEKDNTLYLNHIPKTGGTTLENFADSAQNHNSLFTDWKKTHPDVSTLCFIRDPITRFLSTYNMRAAGHFKFYKKGDSCSQSHMHEYLHNKYLKGELDNHDLPQSDYHCDLNLCFEDFQRDLFNLFRLRGCDLDEGKLQLKKYSW